MNGPSAIQSPQGPQGLKGPQSISKLPSLQGLGSSVYNQNQTNTYTDTYDPYQINSIADVISSAFDPSENGDRIFSLAKFGESYKELWKNNVSNPIQNKQYGALVINNLIGAGETLDSLSNIVKAALPKNWTTAKTYTPTDTVGERVKKAIGIGVQGRYSYDWDVNLDNNYDKTSVAEFLVNFAGEVISDPTNWFLWGKGLVQGTVKGVLTNTDDAAEFIVKHGLNKQQTKAFGRVLAQHGLDPKFTIDNVVTAVKNIITNGDEIASELLDIGTLTKELTNIINVGESVLTHKYNIELLKTINNLGLTGKKIDDTLRFLAGMPIITPAVYTYKHGKSIVGHYLNAQIKNNPYTGHLNQYGSINLVDSDEVNKNISKKAKNIIDTGEVSEDIISDAKHIFEEVTAQSITHQTIMILKEFDNPNLLTTYFNVRKLIKEFTNGVIDNVDDYIKLLDDVYTKHPTIQKFMYDDLVEGLNLLKNNSDLITRYNDKLNLLQAFSGVRLNNPISIDESNPTNIFRRLGEQRYLYTEVIRKFPADELNALFTVDNIYRRFSQAIAILNNQPELAESTINNLNRYLDDLQQFLEQSVSRQSDINSLTKILNNFKADRVTNYNKTSELISKWGVDISYSDFYNKLPIINQTRTHIKTIIKDFPEDTRKILKPILDIDISKADDYVIENYVRTLNRVETALSDYIQGLKIKYSIAGLSNITDVNKTEITALLDLQKKLNSIELDNMRRALDNNNAYIKFKTEEFLKSINRVSGEVPSAINKLFYPEDDTFPFFSYIKARIEELNTLSNIYDAPELDRSLVRLKHQNSQLKIQRDFYNTAKLTLQNEALCTAYFQTIQNYSKVNPLRFLEGDLTDEIVNRMQSNIDNIFMTKKAKLDRVRTLLLEDNKAKQLFDQFIPDKTSITVSTNGITRTLNKTDIFKILVDEGHMDSASDVLATKFSLYYYSPELYNRLDQLSNIKIYDTETTSLNTAIAKLRSIIVSDWNGNSNIYKLRLSMDRLSAEELANGSFLPDLGVLEQKYGVGLSLSEYKNAYLSEYYDSNIRIGDINEWTEERLLNKFNEEIIDTDSIIGMNNLTYDNTILSNRLKDCNIDSKLFTSLKNSSNCYDVYQIIREAQGVNFINAIQYKNIRDLTRSLAGSSLNLGNTGLLDTDVYGMQNNIDNIINLLAEEDTDNALLAYFVDIQEGMEDYIKSIDTQVYSKKFMEDIFKEHASDVRLDKLARKLNYNNTAFKALLKNELNLTDEELSLVFNNKATPILQARVDTWWRYYELQDIYGFRDSLGNLTESFTDFKLRMDNTYGDITNLSKLLSSPDGTSTITYKNMYNSSARSLFKGFDNVRTEVQIRIFEQYETIKEVINTRIKDPEAIFKIGIFKDFNDLKIKTNELINLFQDQPESWIHYIDIDHLYNPEQYIAVYYSIINDSAYHSLLQEKKAVVNAIDNIKKSVFLERSTLDKLLGTNQSLNIDELISSEVYSNANAINRVGKLCERFDDVPNASADGISIRLASEDLSTIPKHLQNDTPIAQRQWIIHSRDVQNKTSWNKALNLLNTFIDNNYNINTEALTGYLLNNGYVSTFSLNPSYSPSKLKWLRIEQNTLKRAQLYEKLVNTFIEQQDELAKVGINVYLDNNTKMVYLNIIDSNYINYSLDNGIMFNGKHYTISNNDFYTYDKVVIKDEYYPNKQELLEQKKMANTFNKDLDLINKYRQKIYDLTGGRCTGIEHTMTKSNYLDFYDNLPKEVKTSLGSIDNFLNSEYWNIKQWDNIDLSPLEYSANKGNILETVFNNFKYASIQEASGMMYLDSYFNTKTSMNINNIFQGISDSEIAKALADDDSLVVSTLIKSNAPAGFEVRRMVINSAADVRLAKQANAVVLPYQVFSKAYQAAEYKSALMKLAQRGMAVYKVGYLADPGTWLRNYIDSTFKTMIETGDPVGTIRNQFKARQLIKDYQDITNKMYIYNPNMQLNSTGIKSFFNRFQKELNLPLTYEEYMFMEGFMKDGPSVGESAALQFWKLKNGSLTSQSNQNLWHRISSGMLKPMSWVEETARTGMYLQLMDEGSTFTKALSRINKTHFDYGMLSPIMQKLQLVIPFANFQLLNFEFWLDIFTKDASVVKLIDEIIQASMNSFDTTPDEYENNRSLQYHLTNGSIQLSESGLVFKANPSYMDAINLLVNPKENILESVFGPYKQVYETVSAEGAFSSGLFLGQEDAALHWQNIADTTLKNTETYPIISTIGQRYLNPESTSRKNYQRLQDYPIQKYIATVLPGTFGAVQKWENYKYVNNYNMNNFYTSFKPKSYKFRPYYPPARPKNLYYKQTRPANQGAYTNSLKLNRQKLRLKMSIKNISI